MVTIKARQITQTVQLLRMRITSSCKTSYIVFLRGPDQLSNGISEANKRLLDEISFIWLAKAEAIRLS